MMFSTSRLLLSIRKVSSLPNNASTISRVFYSTDVIPLQFIGRNFPHVGRIFAETKTTRLLASAIYDEGVIISTAHCFDILIGTPMYFCLGGYNDLQPIKIQTVVKHPEYKKNDDNNSLAYNDIAVALLEKKFPVALPKLEIDYHPTDSELSDSICVGYPAKYCPRQEDDTLKALTNYTPSVGQPHIPIGVLTACYHSKIFPNCLEHKIGYKENKPLPYNILDSGTVSGMSGGGLFTQKNKKLVGIQIRSQNTNNNSHKKGNLIYFNFLAHHKSFLTKQINEFKKEANGAIFSIGRS